MTLKLVEKTGSKVLCEFDNGCKLQTRGVCELDLVMPGLTVTLDWNTVQTIATHWMDVKGIKYHSAKVTL